MSELEPLCRRRSAPRGTSRYAGDCVTCSVCGAGGGTAGVGRRQGSPFLVAEAGATVASTCLLAGAGASLSLLAPCACVSPAPSCDGLRLLLLHAGSPCFLLGESMSGAVCMAIHLRTRPVHRCAHVHNLRRCRQPHPNSSPTTLCELSRAQSVGREGEVWLWQGCAASCLGSPS